MNGRGVRRCSAEAQALGHAEADLSNDVEGPMRRTSLQLAQLELDLALTSQRIRHSGISGVMKRDIARAAMLGYRIRLVAAAARADRGAYAEVAAVLVPVEHPFANVSGPENIVHVVARDAGSLHVRGRGAGGAATASAVLGDTVAALRAIGERHRELAPRALNPALEVDPFFTELARHPELPKYAVWDDALLLSPRRSADVARA